MTLGTLAMIGDLRPPNFLHIVFDNEVYGSTGAQRSATANIALDALARAAGYADVRRAVTAEELDAAIDALLAATGPAFLLVKVDAESNGNRAARAARTRCDRQARSRRAGDRLMPDLDWNRKWGGMIASLFAGRR